MPSSVLLHHSLEPTPRKLCKATTHALTSAPRASFTRFSRRSRDETPQTARLAAPETVADSLKPDVKMWNSNRNGYYKISVDPDSQSLQFYCMESGSDKLTTDC